MNAPTSDHHEVIVIGAGQANLAAGFHLARRGIDFTVLEASRRVGDVWRERYDSLLLYSPGSWLLSNAGEDGSPFFVRPSPLVVGRLSLARRWSCNRKGAM